MTLEKPHAMSLTEHTARTIRQAILHGQLKPGDRVVEVSVAEQLGISRGPVREAILQLASEGLLVIHPRRGAEVRGVDSCTVWEVHTLRANLEVFALRLGFQNFCEMSFRTLRSMVDAVHLASERNDIAMMVTAELSFHREIVDHARHSRLSFSFHALDPVFGVVLSASAQRVGTRIRCIPARYGRILDTLASGDIEQSVQAINDYYHEQTERCIRGTNDGGSSSSMETG